MATALDIGGMEILKIILPVLLVYALVYGVLSYTKIFEKEAVNHLIAIFIALILLLVPSILEVVKYFVPWIAVLLVILLLAIILIRFMGASEKDISDVIKKSSVVYIIITVFVILLIAAIGKVYFAEGEFLEEGGSAVEAISEGKAGTEETGERGFWNTFFSPKILGLLLVMLIAVFAILCLSGEKEK